MTRTRALAVALCVVAVAGTGATACGSDGGGGDGAAVATTEPPATTTTVDPLAQPAVDACGNDLSALTSTVWGIEPRSGAVRWQTSLPVAESYLLRDASGNPRIPLVLRPVEAVVDVATGEVVATPTAGVHEVLVDVTGATASGVAGLLVDGEAQPAVIEVDGVRVTTAAGEVGQDTVSLSAVDPVTAAPAWSVELGAADAVAALSPPVVFGDTVVVLTSPPRPTCP